MECNDKDFKTLIVNDFHSPQRFALLKKEYMEAFEAIFCDQYETIHRLETNKLRNVAKMFAHLLYTDAIPWTVCTVTLHTLPGLLVS